VTDSDHHVLTPEEEAEYRKKARERILAREREKEHQREVLQEERKRKTDLELQRWNIIQEETERFYSERGLVRYVSSTGKTMWIPRDEAERRRGRRVKKRRKKSSQSRRLNVRRWVGSQFRLVGQSALYTIGFVLIILVYVYFTEYFTM